MNGISRSGEMPVRSIGASPSTIHCAISEPAPPESRMPSELRPHAAKNPRSSGTSPSNGPLSGVNDSGPQKNWRIPASCSDGNRSIASERNPAIRSQSGGRTANPRSRGISSSDHAAAWGSKSPTRMPPPSSR